MCCLCEKYYKPITYYSTVQYSTLCSLSTWANFVGLRKKSDLRMHSQNRTCLYVGDLLLSLCTDMFSFLLNGLVKVLANLLTCTVRHKADTYPFLGELVCPSAGVYGIHVIDGSMSPNWPTKTRHNWWLLWEQSPYPFLFLDCPGKRVWWLIFPIADHWRIYPSRASSPNETAFIKSGAWKKAFVYGHLQV